VGADSGYSVIYADPAWSYDDRKNADGWRGTPYDVLSADALAALPVHRLAAPDCVLFLWATNPLLPEAFRVIAGWGFTYKTVAFQWVKLNRKAGTPFLGLGRWTRGNTEPCLLAVRGKPKVQGKDVSQLVIELQGDDAEVLEAPVCKHSAKPDEAAEKIVRLMGDVPRIELFARKPREGWDATGLELDGMTIQQLLARGRHGGK
jgi:N6-adenosine-specific RNA methylase IME4